MLLLRLPYKGEQAKVPSKQHHHYLPPLPSFLPIRRLSTEFCLQVRKHHVLFRKALRQRSTVKSTREAVVFSATEFEFELTHNRHAAGWGAAAAKTHHASAFAKFFRAHRVIIIACCCCCSSVALRCCCQGDRERGAEPCVGNNGGGVVCAVCGISQE